MAVVLDLFHLIQFLQISDNRLLLPGFTWCRVILEHEVLYIDPLLGIHLFKIHFMDFCYSSIIEYITVNGYFTFTLIQILSPAACVVLF